MEREKMLFHEQVYSQFLKDNNLDTIESATIDNEHVEMETSTSSATLPATAPLDFSDTTNMTDIRIVFPEPQERERIDTFVSRLFSSGPGFERVVLERERNSPLFSFLSLYQSPSHHYYRWRVFSIAYGDTFNYWRTARFQMFRNGPYYIPPDIPYTETCSELPEYKSDSDDSIDTDYSSSEENQRSVLSNVGQSLRVSERRFLDSKLRALVSPDRGKIGRLMVWCIDRPNKAQAIACTISESIRASSASHSELILARLYLVSDIIYNSANAFAYVSSFRANLNSVFLFLGNVVKSMGRVRADALKRSIVAVINLWTKWMVFDAPFVQLIADSFMQKPPPTPPAMHVVKNTRSEFIKFSTNNRQQHSTGVKSRSKKSEWKPATLIEDSSNPPLKDSEKGGWKPATLVEDESCPPLQDSEKSGWKPATLVQDTSSPLEHKKSRQVESSKPDTHFKQSIGASLLSSSDSEKRSSILVTGKKRMGEPLQAPRRDFKKTSSFGSLGAKKSVGGGFKISFAIGGKSVLDTVAVHEDIDGDPMTEEDLYEDIDGEPMD